MLCNVNTTFPQFFLTLIFLFVLLLCGMNKGRKFTKIYCELMWNQTVDEALLDLENELYGDTDRRIPRELQAEEANPEKKD
jgi:hypothetical protein